MQFKDIFLQKKNQRFATVTIPRHEMDQKPVIPDGMWCKCDICKQIVYTVEMENYLKCCPSCGHHFRMNSSERIALICDNDSFVAFDDDLPYTNPLSYPEYEDKLQKNASKAGIKEAVVSGIGQIDAQSAVICVMDSNFMMGSMGSAVGEILTRAIERAIIERLPLIIFTASGGARMQEGIISLMQMAKVSGALAKFSKEGLLYITVLTDPTTGGVTASFAMLGDIILAESKALVGFAGRRVIEQTIKQKLPDDFQRAEFLLEKGFVDSVIERKNLKSTLSLLLTMHGGGVEPC